MTFCNLQGAFFFKLFIPAAHYMLNEINNSDLRINQIPEITSEYGSIADFALTFDGYKWSDQVGAFANKTVGMYYADESSLKLLSLTELRACLFFEQRRYRHMDEEPENGDREYINALLAEIINRVNEDKTE